MYLTEYDEPVPPDELTPAQRELADAMAAAMTTVIINALIEVATPYGVVEDLCPSCRQTKYDSFAQKCEARRAERKARRDKAIATTPAAEAAPDDDTSTRQIIVGEGHTIQMTSQQFQYAFVTWLAREPS